MPSAELDALLAGVHRLVQDPEALAPLGPGASEARRRRYLEELGLAPGDLEALLELPPGRLLVYRRLVRQALASAVRRQMPRSAARLGARFEAEVERFCDEELPRSPYLRDVPAEFLRFARPRWSADPALPRYLPDLAAHELCAFEVRAAPDAPDASERGEPVLFLERPLVFHPSARLGRYAFAVHLLPEAEDARNEPEARETFLFAYRDAEHEARFLELSPLAAEIAARLLGGEPLGPAVRRACEARSAPPGGGVLEGVSALLADLAERGALLGAGASGSSGAPGPPPEAP